jgi:protein TonB
MTLFHSASAIQRLALFASLFAAVAGPLSADDLIVRISDAEAQKAATAKANPEYPAMARQMRVSGSVIVEAAVTTEGEVEKVQPVSGNALLSSAAVAAVKKWKFKPFTAEGKPAKAVVRLAFNFTL